MKLYHVLHKNAFITLQLVVKAQTYIKNNPRKRIITALVKLNFPSLIMEVSKEEDHYGTPL